MINKLIFTSRFYNTPTTRIIRGLIDQRGNDSSSTFHFFYILNLDICKE